MKATKGVGWLVIMCTLFVCTVSVEATPVVIPLDDSGWAAVIDDVMLYETREVGAPYVFGIIDDAVIIQLDKTFREPLMDGFFDPIVIEFQKIRQTDITNIIIRDERIANCTGSEWFDFHLHLTSAFAGFNPDFIPDGDQLENVSYSMNFGYDGLPVRLNFEDNNASGVPAAGDVFEPGRIAGQIMIVTDPEMGVGPNFRFGLKEVPTVPEPATLALLGIGGLMALNRKRRRQA